MVREFMEDVGGAAPWWGARIMERRVRESVLAVQVLHQVALRHSWNFFIYEQQHQICCHDLFSPHYVSFLFSPRNTVTFHESA